MPRPLPTMRQLLPQLFAAMGVGHYPASKLGLLLIRATVVCKPCSQAQAMLPLITWPHFWQKEGVYSTRQC